MHFSLRCRFALLAGAIVNGSILEPKRSPRRANSTKQLGGSQDDSPFFDNLIDPQPLLLREKSSDILAGGTGRCYGAGGEGMATSSLHLNDGVPRCPNRTI